jgi:hypothetical protein
VPAGRAASPSEEGVRLAQEMQASPRIPAEIQLQKAEVGPTSGPTWRLSHVCGAEALPHSTCGLLNAASTLKVLMLSEVPTVMCDSVNLARRLRRFVWLPI